MGKRWVSQKITQAAQQISTVNWSSIRKSTRWASAQVWSACTFYTIQMKETNSISQNSTCRPCSQLFRELHFNIHSRFFWHFCLYRLSPTMIVIQLFNRYLYHIIVDTYIYIYMLYPQITIFTYIFPQWLCHVLPVFSPVPFAGAMLARLARSRPRSLSPRRCIASVSQKKPSDLAGFFGVSQWVSGEFLIKTWVESGDYPLVN